MSYDSELIAAKGGSVNSRIVGRRLERFGLEGS